MADVSRIEEKVDAVNVDMRQLITGIHEQSLAIVKMTEQMKHTTEAISRAHNRIDDMDTKVDVLRDLPAKFNFLEKRVDALDDKISKVGDSAGGNSNKLAAAQGATGVISRFGPWMMIGAVVCSLGAILALLGAAKKLFSD